MNRPERRWERDEWEERLEEKLAQLGTREPGCNWPGCDEECPFALTGADPEIYCYDHQPQRRSRPWLEEHHSAGQHNDPQTAAMPGNEHRIASELQYAWPEGTLRNPDGSPLLRAAAALRGWLDLLYLVMVRTVAWIPAFLEQLDAFLRERLGPRWWNDLDD